jgi:hypothetical protein
VDYFEYLRRELPDLPSPQEEDCERRIGQAVRRVQRQANGAGRVIGHAIEHSIEDPFTGEITVRILLD